MSLQIWLPFNGNLNHNGLDTPTLTTSGTISYSNGKIGKALSLAGSTNIKIPYNHASTEKLSICFWVKPNSPDAWSDIISFGDSDNRLEKTSTTTYTWYSNNTTSNLTTSGTSLFALQNDIWYHFAMTCDGTNVKFYLNGKLAKTITQAHSISTVFGTNSNIFISSRIAGANKYKGYLNDFRIYDEVLSAKEIYEISKGLVLHYKLSGIGGENLVPSSIKNVTSSAYGFAGTSTLTLENSTKYTLTVNGRVDSKTSEDNKYLAVFIYCSNWTWSQSISIHEKEDTTRSLTFTTPSDISSKGVWIMSYYYPSSGTSTGTATINWYKLEKGSKSTPWCPNSADTLYSTLGYNDNVEYDCSGFGNNGTKTDGISWDNNSVRYSGSYKFPSSTYIACSSNAKVTDQITVNIWAYMNTWDDCHPFSCTDNGGWNLESNGGYVAFPIYVNGTYYYAKSNILMTSLSSGWHMFTGTWDGYSVKLYIDGNLAASTTVSTTKSAIGYYAGNTIFLHAEAHTNMNTPDTSRVFPECNLSDFRIYATALSDEDIKALYKTKFSIDNQGSFYCGELVETMPNILFDAQRSLMDKSFSNGISSYVQANCQVTLTDNGYRIYRPPNLTVADHGNTMWGGLKLQNPGHWLTKGHTYIVLFNVKGASSQDQTHIGWTYSMGWEGDSALKPAPKNISYSFISNNFNDEKLCYYKFTIEDDIYKVCKTSFAGTFVAGNSYLSYKHFQFGFNYESTGALGTDLYLTNFRMYDITELENSKFDKNSILECISVIEGNEKLSIGKYGEIYTNNINEL